MAHKQAGPALVMVALLLFGAATPTAYGQLGVLDGVLRSIFINGRFCCAPLGNCNGTTVGVPGAVFSVNCTNKLAGGSITVGKGVTGVNGLYNISIANILGLVGALISILGGDFPCVVIFNLPIINQAVCPLLSNATGTLIGVTKLVDTIVSPTLGLVGNLTVSSLFNAEVGI